MPQAGFAPGIARAPPPPPQGDAHHGPLSGCAWEISRFPVYSLSLCPMNAPAWLSARGW